MIFNDLLVVAAVCVWFHEVSGGFIAWYLDLVKWSKVLGCSSNFTMCASAPQGFKADPTKMLKNLTCCSSLSKSNVDVYRLVLFCFKGKLPDKRLRSILLVSLFPKYTSATCKGLRERVV